MARNEDAPLDPVYYSARIQALQAALTEAETTGLPSIATMLQLLPQQQLREKFHQSQEWAYTLGIAESEQLSKLKELNIFGTSASASNAQTSHGAS